MPVQSSRIAAGATLVTLATLLAGCASDGPLAPSAKQSNLITPLVTSSADWDFAAIIPGSGDPEDLGTSETISLAGNGSIVATTGGATQHITVKGRSLPVGDTERGLGLCLTDQPTCTFPADGDEVGDGGPGTLDLDFSGVLPAGSHLAQIDLGSLQDGEGYRYSISTDGGSTFGSPVDVPDPGDADDNASLVLDLPTAGLVVRLEKLPGGSGDNDYTVKAATTSFSSTELEGRMTGGGVKAYSDAGDPVTLGLTLHCDILLSNNLEVNWGGHQWHLAKPIVSSLCTNEPDIQAPPPASPINTFEGTAYGRLDGVANSLIEWRFQDAGEPGSDDTIEMTIYQPGSNSDVALHVAFQKLSVGNFQMHYDQPHGQKP